MRHIVFFLLPSMLAFAQVNEEMTVTVREIRVHVLNSEGEPVKGLSPANFKVSQEKGLTDVTFFEEVDLFTNYKDLLSTEEEKQEKNEMSFAISDRDVSRKVVLFVDSSHLTQGNFEQVRDSLIRFIDTQLNPNDLVKMVHWDDDVKHLTAFIRDRETLITSLSEMKFKGQMLRDMNRAQNAIDSEIKEWDVLENPELKYAYENSINQLIKQKARLKANHYRTFYLNILDVSTILSTMDGPKSIFLFTGGSYLEVSNNFGNTTDLSERLAEKLNRSNTTIYTILLKQTKPVGGSPPFLQNQNPNFANRFKNFSTFPPNAQFTADIANNTISEDNVQIETGPAAAADMSGGLFLKSFGNTNIEEQLEQVQNVSSHYYRLAFLVDNPENAASVKVSLQNKERGWKLLYGGDFGVPTPYLELPKDERRIERHSLLVYGSKFRDDFNADWEPRLFGDEKSGFRVAMMGKFALTNPPANGYEMGFAILDENRELLDLTIPIVNEFPKTDTFSTYDVLLSPKRPAFFRFYVRDMDNGDYSLQEFTIKKPIGDQNITRLSEVFMDQAGGDKTIALNQLDFVKKGELMAPDDVVARSDLDPFRMEDNVYSPDIRPYAFKPGVLGFLILLENPTDEKENPYQVQYLVKSQEGYLKVPGRVVSSWTDPTGSLHFQGQIKTSELPKGSYALYIRVSRASTGETYTKGATFELK